MNDNKETRKMKKIIIIFTFLILVLLTACSAPGGEDSVVNNQDQAGDTVSSTTLIQVDAGAPQPAQSEDIGNSTQLSESYADALPVQTQLALGTILLEDGELAVVSDQAAELLQLWRVVQSLTESGTAAGAEITSVVGQIQEGMTAEQISAIADMHLTQEAIRSLVQDGSIAIAREDVKSGATGATVGGGAPGGGGGGPLGGQTDPSQQATRQAAQGDGGNDRLAQAVTNAVIQVLEAK
jgi:hypothetical protein